LKKLYNDPYLEISQRSDSDIIDYSVLHQGIATNSGPELVAYLIRNSKKEFHYPKLWKMKITGYSNIDDCLPVLYWLSGGDIEWGSRGSYSNNWSDFSFHYQLILGPLLHKDILACQNLGELWYVYKKKWGLLKFYEIALRDKMFL
jgi:hypothetical protein